jgi:hypothetical protein
VLHLTETRVAIFREWGGHVWESAVPIYELLGRQGVFTPDEVALLGNVFEDVLRTFDLVDRQDPLAATIANCLVENARTGIRDPEHLKTITIQAVTQQRQQQIMREKR